MLLAVKILLTITTLGYSAVPTFFDFNASHATNPSWTGHARYHVVWQVTSFDYMAILALFLIWTAGADTWPLWIAALLSAAAYGGFWTSYLTRPLYGGWLVDKVNGVPPFNWNIGGWKFQTDANVTLFTPLVVLVIIAMILLAQIPA